MKCDAITLKKERCRNEIPYGNKKYCHVHSKAKKKCQEEVSKKIKENMKELKKGVWKSKEQAIAVSISQVKKNKNCKQFYR